MFIKSRIAPKMPERYSALKVRLNATLQAYGLQKNTDLLLLAVSGGRDSMLLFELLYTNGWRIHVAHVNYGLRGSESDEDATFVSNACKHNKVPFSIYEAQQEMQGITKGNLQENARTLRYAWFEELRVQLNAAAIVLAHHMADQTETFFLQAASGKPTKGMPEKRGKVIRPMLSFSPEEISILIEHSKPLWREDSSNKSDKYRRNLFRNNVLPELRQKIGDFDRIIFETCKRNEAAEKLLDHWLKAALPKSQVSENEFSVKLNPLLQLPDPAFALHHLLHRYGFSYAICEQMATKLTSTEERHFRTAQSEVRLKNLLLSVNVAVKGGFKPTINAIPQINARKVDHLPDFHLNSNINVVYLSIHVQESELHVRKRQNADYFYPSGMNGKKKLSDFFTDLKLSQKEKDEQWLLCCGNDIAWVVNRRISELYKIKPDDTEAWRVELIFDEKPNSPE
jgi:tRNA(Ile)-lysidine synthase